MHGCSCAVAVIDPLFVLEPERLSAATATSAAQVGGDAAGVQPFVTLSVPFRLLALLNQGHLELADHDDPGNHWCVAGACRAGWQVGAPLSIDH
jgi:hypothetical protein